MILDSTQHFNKFSGSENLTGYCALVDILMQLQTNKQHLLSQEATGTSMGFFFLEEATRKPA